MLHLILYQRLGENANTSLSPLGPIEGERDGLVLYRTPYCQDVQTADLTRTDLFCAYFDDDRLVRCDVYGTEIVDIPDWLDPLRWIVDEVEWRHLWGQMAYANAPRDAFDETAQRWFFPRSPAVQYAMIRLLRARPERMRSELRIKLRQQVLDWLAQAPDPRQYESPLSRRQMEVLVGDRERIESRRIEEAIYHNR